MPKLHLAYEKLPWSDEVTPQAVFDKVDGEYPCLLESSKGGRYSYIAYDPYLFIWRRRGGIEVSYLNNFFDLKKNSAQQLLEEGDAWIVEEMLQPYVLDEDLEIPFPFCGGAVGYLSYDYGCSLMGIEQKVFDDVKIPDYGFGFYDKAIVFDHEEEKLYLVAVGENSRDTQEKIRNMRQVFERSLPLRRQGMMGPVESNLSGAAYREKIDQIKNLLKKGETYQVNFSQRFSGDCTLDSWLLYKKLVHINPVPFGCFFAYPDFAIVSSSPELLLRKRGQHIETWPIKGTMPRGKDATEQQKQIDNLLASKKDSAELAMIVDLERNDLGRICELGSVHVDAHKAIQECSHVVHTFSCVSGTLLPDMTMDECLRALFPGGSITGCPKKRTMEIIDQLEDYKRGIYTGSAGFISFSGNSDFNILIRTMLLKDGKVYFHAGGGIVMDSNPRLEYKETVDKIAALKATLMR